MDLVLKARDVLSHSRYYAQVKIARALSNQWEEARDQLDRELADSKTSALFAYVSIERNSRALLALSTHKPLRPSREKYLRLAKTSLDLLQVIRQEFFPREKLSYQEIGSASYDHYFAIPQLDADKEHQFRKSKAGEKNA